MVNASDWFNMNHLLHLTPTSNPPMTCFSIPFLVYLLSFCDSCLIFVACFTSIAPIYNVFVEVDMTKHNNTLKVAILK